MYLRAAKILHHSSTHVTRHKKHSSLMTDAKRVSIAACSWEKFAGAVEQKLTSRTDRLRTRSV